jgi:hypothetical protein
MERSLRPWQPDLFEPRPPAFGSLPEATRRAVVAQLRVLLTDAMRTRPERTVKEAGHVE